MANDGPKRRIVEGEVIFNDVPVDYGLIRFAPQPDGPIVTAEILKGKYHVDNKGGVPVGKVRVEITATPNTGNMSEEELRTHPPAPAVIIPARYNTSSVLMETVSDEGGTQELNFRLGAK